MFNLKKIFNLFHFDYSKRRVIKLADFNETPMGRYRTDCEANATAFRDDILKPALQDAGTVVVNLDGILGCSSSFLDETFSKLPPELARRVRIECSDPVMAIYKMDAESYLKAATESRPVPDTFSL